MRTKKEIKKKRERERDNKGKNNSNKKSLLGEGMNYELVETNRGFK